MEFNTKAAKLVKSNYFSFTKVFFIYIKLDKALKTVLKLNVAKTVIYMIIEQWLSNWFKSSQRKLETQEMLTCSKSAKQILIKLLFY